MKPGESVLTYRIHKNSIFGEVVFSSGNWDFTWETLDRLKKQGLFVLEEEKHTCLGKVENGVINLPPQP